MSVAWVVVQLAGNVVAFAYVLAFLVAAFVVPPYLSVHYGMQWLRSR